MNDDKKLLSIRNALKTWLVCATALMFWQCVCSVVQAKPVIVEAGNERELESALGNLVTTIVRLKKDAKITLTKDITKIKHNAIGIEGKDSTKRAVIQGTKMCDWEPCGKDKGHSIRLDEVNPDLDFIKNIAFDRGLAENFGSGSGGGAFYIAGSLLNGVKNSEFTNNSTDQNGGALFVGESFGGGIHASLFKNNNSSVAGGAIYIQDKFFGNIKGSQFSKNASQSNGGAIFVGDTLKGGIHDHSTFEENRADGSGGALYAATFGGGISDSAFHANKAKIEGGAIYVDTKLSGDITGSTFSENDAAGQGGAIYVGDTLAGDIFSSHFKDNSTGKNGGALYSLHIAGDIASSRFENNQANERGGALFIEGKLKGWVKNSNFTDNSADKDGGAIYVLNLVGGVYGGKFHKNRATENGGAIYVGDALEGSISNSVFRGNSADYLGGAIFSYQFDGAIKNSIFTDNTSAGWGGALYFGKSDKGTIEGSIFVANMAERNKDHPESGGLGGAIFSYGRDGNNNLYLANSAFLKNAALSDKKDVYGGHGGAIFHNAAKEEGDSSILTIAATGGESSLFYGNRSRSGEEALAGKGGHANAIYLGNMWEEDRKTQLIIQTDEDSDIFMLDPIESQGKAAEDVDEHGDDIVYGNLDVNVKKGGMGNWYLGGESLMHSDASWNIDEGSLILTEVDEAAASITLAGEKADFHVGKQGTIAGSGLIVASDISISGALEPSAFAKFGSAIDNIADEETMDVWVEKISDYGKLAFETWDDEAIKLQDMTYVVDVGDDENDLITAKGDIEIEGGAINIRSHITSKDENNRYRETSHVIMESEQGTISGKFDVVKSDFAFWKAQINYLNGQVLLDFVRDDAGAREGCVTRNQCQVGEAIIGLEDGHQLKDALIDSTTKEIGSAYDNLSGEIYASSRAALLGDTSLLKIIDRHMAHRQFTSFAQSDVMPIWFSTFGSDGHLFSNHEAARLRRTSHGTTLGFDGNNGDGLFAGFVLGYENYRMTNGLSRNSRSDIDSYDIGISAAGDWYNFHMNGGMIYSQLDIHTERDIWIASRSASLEGTAKADYSGHKLQFFGEIATDVHLGEALTLSPYLQLSHSILHTSPAHESGTKAALDIAGRRDSLLTTTLGLRGFADLPILEKTGSDLIRLYGSLGWMHSLQQGSAKSHNHLRAAGKPFIVEGVDFERDAGFVEMGVRTSLGNAASLDVGYQGHFGRNLIDHGATVHLNVTF